ncbi:hypothetical protein L7F22_043444 [Adiantum nelumboides]|nr:hypothetical protein [Adiantum nelumboides]
MCLVYETSIFIPPKEVSRNTPLYCTTYGFIPAHQEERILEKSLGETSKRGISKVREGENPYEELQNLLLDDIHQSRRRGHAQRQEPPSKEKERSQSPDESMEEDVAPRRRQAQRSPTPTKRKRSPHSPPRRESKKEEKDSKKKKERKRSPSSPSSSPSSSSDESGGYSSRASPRRGHRRSHAAWRRSNKLKKFKEGGKSISFLTYDGTFGATDKVLAFIQQFDAAFGDEGFTESSKLRHVAMHFQKSARQWYVDKFWDLHLKASVYKKIDFEEQKQHFCAGLPEDMNEYVNSQRPKSISSVIHHTMFAARINFQQGAKRNLKPMETKEKHEQKGKNQPQNSSNGNSSNNKAKEKGVYKGKDMLILEELEHYRKDNRCFKCGEQGHAYQACPQRNARNEQPRASIIEAPKEDVHCKGSPLSYAWGKVREHDAFILFDPGSTHNFISHELAAKVGIQEFEMRDAMKADGAFIGQDASVTPLIGKLRLHIQGYVDKEDFFISPLKHEDVILGAPWFDHLVASIKFPQRRISFKFRKKNMYIDAQESCNTIPLEVDAVSLDLSMSFTELLHSGQSKRVQASKDVSSTIEVPALDEYGLGTRKTNRKKKMTEKMRSLHERDHAHKREVSLKEKMTNKHDETVKNDNQFQDILDSCRPGRVYEWPRWVVSASSSQVTQVVKVAGRPDEGRSTERHNTTVEGG